MSEKKSSTDYLRELEHRKNQINKIDKSVFERLKFLYKQYPELLKTLDGEFTNYGSISVEHKIALLRVVETIIKNNQKYQQLEFDFNAD